MAISFVGAGALASGNAPTTLTPAIPVGAQAGDLILALSFDRGTDTNVTRTGPSGYTGEQTVGMTPGATQAFLYYKVHSGSESNPVFTFSGAVAGNDIGAQVAVFRGVDNVTPIDASGAAGGADAGVNADLGPIVGFTPATSGAAIVVFGAKRGNLGGAGFAVLTGDGLTWAEIGDHSLSAGSGLSAVWDYALNWSSGAITAKTFDTTSTSTSAWRGQMFALRPTAGHVVTAVPASATGSEPTPLPKLAAIPGPSAATGSGVTPVPKLSVVSPIAAATASEPTPVPKITVGPSAASATASAPVPTLVTTALNIRQPPPASASASFPTPTKTSSGLTAVTPPASANASLPTPSPALTLTAPVGSATSSALTPLPLLTVLPSPAFATAEGVVPSPSAVVIGVPVASATAQAPVPVPVIAIRPDAASATAMGVPPQPSAGTAQFLARLPTHLVFARNTTTLVLEGAEMALAIDG